MSSETQTDDPIHVCMERWHQHMNGELEGGFDAILHPDVTFISPVVFTPQEGIDVTKLYLMAAGGTLGGGNKDRAEREAAEADGKAFRYTKKVLDGHHAVLEFETYMGGKYVNGVDIFTCDDDGMITELKVMIRPLQAVNIVHEQMKAMLETLGSSETSGA